MHSYVDDRGAVCIGFSVPPDFTKIDGDLYHEAWRVACAFAGIKNRDDRARCQQRGRRAYTKVRADRRHWGETVIFVLARTTGSILLGNTKVSGQIRNQLITAQRLRSIRYLKEELILNFVWSDRNPANGYHNQTGIQLYPVTSVPEIVSNIYPNFLQ
jgi:hypothetical protein